MEMVQEIISAGYKLVICPDSSSNDYEQHRLLKEAGIDVLVIDHHEADKVSENAVVINNQLCNYPTKSLSGVGMVYKFCCYLDSIMGVNTADNFLDLVALNLSASLHCPGSMSTRHKLRQTQLVYLLHTLYHLKKARPARYAICLKSRRYCKTDSLLRAGWICHDQISGQSILSPLSALY